MRKLVVVFDYLADFEGDSVGFNRTLCILVGKVIQQDIRLSEEKAIPPDAGATL